MATQTFSETLVKNETKIKPIHLEELQEAINTWQAAYSISETSWLVDDAKDVKMKASQMADMQNALDALKTLIGEGNFSWSYTAVKNDIARATVPNEIRDNINYIQDGKCYLCHSCDTETCTCDSSCDSDGCDTCDAAFYPACLCNTGCYNHTCDLCNAARYPSCTCNTACDGDVCSLCNLTCHNSYVKGICNWCYAWCFVDGCDLCDGAFYPSCSCNTGCYNDTCDLCNAARYPSCTCNTACDGDVCSQCDASCYAESCTKCDGVNYEYPWS